MTAIVEAKWIDGPSIVRWFEKKGIKGFDTLTYARMSRWRRGGKANVYQVDELLTHYGYNLQEIPEEFFRMTRNREHNEKIST